MENTISMLIMLMITFPIAIWDWKFKKIPNLIVFPGMLAGLVLSAMNGEIINRLEGVGAILLVSFLVYKLYRHCIGMGDLKLWMMCNCFMGLLSSWYIFTISQIIMLLYLIYRGRIRKLFQGFFLFVGYGIKPVGTEKVPFAPFFMASMTIYVIVLMIMGKGGAL